MFSLDKFYNILHNNLIDPLNNSTQSVYFYPFGTYHRATYIGSKFENSKRMTMLELTAEQSLIHCYFFDQEPLYDYTTDVVKSTLLNSSDNIPTRQKSIAIFANSEKSETKNTILKKTNLKDWYYFFHGFAALDWFRDFQYIRSDKFNGFNKVFICYNHLISKYRSYRLHLVSNLLDQDLVRHGSVSLSLEDEYGTWRDAVYDKFNPLDSRAKEKIQISLSKISQPLVADTDSVDGTFSANINYDHLTSALFHVVTETVYFLPKLHLTEKIFKPIVCKRPFILVAAPGNLAYLKSYGFQTFDRWVDESYDQEPDNYLRIEMITQEIKRLCSMSKSQLNQIYQEMQEVLEYNHTHFYGSFKRLIVNELVDNFNGILIQHNNGRQPNNHSRFHRRYEFPAGYLDQVKQLLSS